MIPVLPKLCLGLLALGNVVDIDENAGYGRLVEQVLDGTGQNSPVAMAVSEPEFQEGLCFRMGYGFQKALSQ
jgi:hypothetical protein